MALSDPLATVEEYSAVYPTADDTNVLLRQLKACSRLLEKEAKQFFTRDAAPVDRIWVAKYTDYLDLWGTRDWCPGIASTEGLIVKEDSADDGTYATTWSPNQYELLPRDALLGPVQRPYDRISIPRWSSRSFAPGRRYQVTAIYGWPEIPDTAKEDVIELCAIWRADSSRATDRMNDLNEVVNSSPIAKSLIARFKNAFPGKVTF